MVYDKSPVVVGVPFEIGKTVVENIGCRAVLVGLRLKGLEIGSVFAPLQGDGLERQRVTACERLDLDVLVVDDGNGADIREIFGLLS